jgi:hypothetical protein
MTPGHDRTDTTLDLPLDLTPVTPAFAAHHAFVRAVKATLVRRGRGGQELESHLAAPA